MPHVSPRGPQAGHGETHEASCLIRGDSVHYSAGLAGLTAVGGAAALPGSGVLWLAARLLLDGAGADIEAPATAVAIPDTVNGHVLTHQWMIIRRSNKRRGRPEQAWTSPAMTVGGCNGACRYRIGVASSLGRSLPTQRLV